MKLLKRYSHAKSIVSYVFRVYDLPNIVLHLPAFVFIFITITANEPWIDMEHFEKYPYCGQVSTVNPSNSAQERVVNSKVSTESYRWVVRIARSNLQKDGTMEKSFCSGTVITNR